MFYSDIHVDKLCSVIGQISMEENLDQLIRFCVAFFSSAVEPVFLAF